MAKITITVQTHSHGSVTVSTVWHGKNLAIHGTVTREGKATGARARYAITHLVTGMAACPDLQVSRIRAVKLARLWDSRFADINESGDARNWRYRQTWLADVNRVANGTEPEGPILPDNPTSTDVGRAIVGAVYGAESAADADEDSRPYPVTETAPHRPGADVDGWPHTLWRGNWYPVPTVGEVEGMICDSVCETPDGRTVEPDHPESWLTVLGLI